MSDGTPAFAEDMAVEVRYPRTKQEEQGDRADWPWLPPDESSSAVRPG